MTKVGFVLSESKQLPSISNELIINQNHVFKTVRGGSKKHKIQSARVHDIKICINL